MSSRLYFPVCSFGPVVVLLLSASLTSSSELSGTCRIWRPCWRVARREVCGLWSTWWWGAPGPEERSRAWRRPRGSAYCTAAGSERGTGKQTGVDLLEKTSKLSLRPYLTIYANISLCSRIKNPSFLHEKQNATREPTHVNQNYHYIEPLLNL